MTKPKSSYYHVEEDGSVSYTGKPEDFSQDMAAAVASGLELGSTPPATGNPEAVKDEKASAKADRKNPDLEMGVKN